MNFYYETDRQNIHITANPRLACLAHFHKNIELIYVKQGTARAFADKNEYFLEEGDFFIAFPEVIHSYDNCSNDNTILILVSSTLFPDYTDIFTNKVPISALIHNAPWEAKELLKIIETAKDSYDTPVIRGALLSLFGMLLSKMEFTEYKRPSHGTLQQIIRYCVHNYKTNITVATMAAELNLSKNCISQTFSTKIHSSFREYINTLRLKDAISLLENTNKSITDIVAESGFETIRTFNRVFKDRYGMTPLDYRNSTKKSK